MRNRRTYEKESIENSMADSSVFVFGNWGGWSDPANFADYSVFTGGIVLFCKRIGTVSQVVYWDKAL